MVHIICICWLQPARHGLPLAQLIEEALNRSWAAEAAQNSLALIHHAHMPPHWASQLTSLTCRAHTKQTFNNDAVSRGYWMSLNVYSATSAQDYSVLLYEPPPKNRNAAHSSRRLMASKSSSSGSSGALTYPASVNWAKANYTSPVRIWHFLMLACIVGRWLRCHPCHHRCDITLALLLK